MTRPRLAALFVVILAATPGGQTRLAPDIHPESLSRVPPVDRATLDANGQRIWDTIANGRPLTRTGPAAVSMHSPMAAEPVHALNQYLRKTVVGSRFFELRADCRARNGPAVRMVRP